MHFVHVYKDWVRDKGGVSGYALGNSGTVTKFAHGTRKESPSGCTCMNLKYIKQATDEDFAYILKV